MADTDETATEPAAALDLSEAETSAQALAATLEKASASFSRTLVGGMQSAVLEGRRLDSILRSAVLNMSSAAIRSALTPLTNLVGQGTSSLVSSLAGGLVGSSVANGGNLVPSADVTPFAKGGVLDAPTLFPLDRGLGVAGEAGAEAVLPLARGPNGAMGVQVAGPSATAAPITINIQTADVESFRRSEAQVTAMLARAVGRGRRGI